MDTVNFLLKDFINLDPHQQWMSTAIFSCVWEFYFVKNYFTNDMGKFCGSSCFNLSYFSLRIGEVAHFLICLLVGQRLHIFSWITYSYFWPFLIRAYSFLINMQDIFVDPIKCFLNILKLYLSSHILDFYIFSKLLMPWKIFIFVCM